MQQASRRWVLKTILFTVAISLLAVIALYCGALFGNQTSMTVLLVVILPEANLASMLLPEDASAIPAALELMLLVAALQLAVLLSVVIVGARMVFRWLVAARRGGVHE